MRGVSAGIAALALVACADPKPNVTFSDEGPGIVRGYTVLKSGPDTATKGWPGTELHVAIAASLPNVDQRATLQHVIDSIVAKDTNVFWLRVTAFAPNKPEPGAADVPLYPRLQAIWAPPDTNDPGSRSHKAVHRVYFTIIVQPDSGARR